MVFKRSFNSLVATRKTPFFAFDLIISEEECGNIYELLH